MNIELYLVLVYITKAIANAFNIYIGTHTKRFININLQSENCANAKNNNNKQSYTDAAKQNTQFMVKFYTQTYTHTHADIVLAAYVVFLHTPTHII